MDQKVKVLHSRDVYFALKEHGGKAIQHLMKKFDFATEDSLFEAIKKVSPSEADTLIRDLKSKAKKDPKNKKPKNKSKVQNDYEIKEKLNQPNNLVSEGNCAEIVQELASETENIEECALQKGEEHSKEESKTPDKATLKEQEEQISEELRALEVQYQQERTNKDGIRKEAAQAQRAADELARLLKVQRANVSEIVERYNACGTRMEELVREMKPRKELLEELRTQIYELDKVTILVYQNGAIEVENGEVPLVSDKEITETLIMLVSMPKVGKITIDELKAIAKLLKMVKVYETNGTPFELEFDSAEVQRLWETVTTA